MAQQRDPIKIYDAAAQGFRQRLSGVQANQMSSPTPCTEWDVEALINHNINATGFAEGVFLIDMTRDLLVHTWDLAKGTNQNTTLDSGLVEVIYHAFAPQMDGMRQMEFEGIKPMGPEVLVPASASLQDRFIGMMGRQP